MLAKIVKKISYISEDNSINAENYMEAINFINNIYKFVNKIKLIVPINDIEFVASFKGRSTCERFNIQSNEEENEMRYFITKSAKFLEDKEQKTEQLKEIMRTICKTIEFEGEIIRFTLI